VAFSFDGLKKLAPTEEVGQFNDTAFRKGLAARSEELGDPQEGEGSPSTWVVGGPGNEPDAVLIVASDLECDLLAEVSRIEKTLFAAGLGNGRGAAARITYKEQGEVLPRPLRGREHFGFLDGISQPGLRGRISDDPRDVLTYREDSTSPDHGKPGQDLIWPGEFVFGYPGQDPKDADRKGPNSLQPNGHRVAPEWAKDGSFLVIRRLRQDVQTFREFVAGEAARLGLSPDEMAAKIIGRFPSGAPIVLTPREDLKLGAADDRNNNFEFHSESGEDIPGADDFGTKCPYAGHIRKVYPRNDRDRFVSGNGEADAQKHRVIRRGIPFGAPYLGTSEPGGDDGTERGLLFLAYQTSIENQFEHIQKQFANNVEPDAAGEMRAGYDLIIGQNPKGPRPFVVPQEDQGKVKRSVVDAPRQWVLPTGGGYFFSPSISALARFATKAEAKVEKEAVPQG
jgi:Dyp-type peroxidase family